jgi:SAM-dependent methyltransferase
VCCGSGHVTKELANRGYQVTGVDNSKALIALARQQLPEVDFHVQDVCELSLPGRFAGAISTFDSLNHILTLDRLQQAFAAVRAQLEPGGRFVFDMNLHEAYTIDIKQWSVDIHDNSVGLVRGQYDPIERRARTELVWFSRRTGEPECWTRRHSVVNQQCYALDEILNALRAAGFQKIESAPAIDLGVGADMGYGRIFVSAQTPTEQHA